MLFFLFVLIIWGCVYGIADWQPTFEQKFLIWAVLGIGAVLTLLKSL
jgi:hypothetical protein